MLKLRYLIPIEKQRTDHLRRVVWPGSARGQVEMLEPKKFDNFAFQEKMSITLLYWRI